MYGKARRSILIINKKLRSGEEKIDSYIEELENELLKKQTSSIDKFIRSANEVASVMADDLSFIAKKQPEKCVILTADSSDKSVERIFMMLKNNELFAEIAKTADTLLPDVLNESQDLVIELNPEENAFEQMQKRIREKRKK